MNFNESIGSSLSHPPTASSFSDKFVFAGLSLITTTFASDASTEKIWAMRSSSSGPVTNDYNVGYYPYPYGGNVGYQQQVGYGTYGGNTGYQQGGYHARTSNWGHGGGMRSRGEYEPGGTWQWDAYDRWQQDSRDYNSKKFSSHQHIRLS